MSNHADRKTIVCEVFENQRYYPLGGWSDAVLPLDWESWSDRHGETRHKHDFNCKTGYLWESDWIIEVSKATDKEGWRYAGGFPTGLHTIFEHSWSSSSGMLDMCRSRRWVRRQQRKSSGVDVVANARKQRETTRLARTRETERQQQQRAELMGGAIPHKPAPRSALDPRSSRITSKGVKTAQGTYTAQEYVDRLHQDNTRSLDNTLRVMYDSDRLASENLSTLQKQTEQMKRIDNDLQEMDATLTASDRIVTNIASWTGRFSNMFSSDSADNTLSDAEVRRQVAVNTTGSDLRGRTNNLQTTQSSRTARSRTNSRDPTANNVSISHAPGARSRNGRSGSNISQSSLENTYQAGIERENMQLDELMGVLGRVQANAEDTNRELRTQEVYISHVGNNVERTNSRINKTNARLGELS